MKCWFIYKKFSLFLRQLLIVELLDETYNPFLKHAHRALFIEQLLLIPEGREMLRT
jgi:hypothetical protein